MPVLDTFAVSNDVDAMLSAADNAAILEALGIDNPNTLQVSPGEDTFSAAMAAADALEPSETNPTKVVLAPGAYTQTVSVTVTSPWITIAGSGIRATRITWADDTLLTVAAANVTVQDMGLFRADDGEPDAVFTMTGAAAAVPSLAGWLPDQMLRNVLIANSIAGGTAIGTLTAVSHGLVVRATAAGGIAIEKNMGGIHHGHDIWGAKHAVKDSLSINELGAHSPVDVHQASFNNGTLTSTDETGGWTIRGSAEDAEGDISHNPADLAWNPTLLSGGQVFGPKVPDGTGPGATSPAVLDCLDISGTKVDADTITTRLYSGRWTGGMAFNGNSDTFPQFSVNNYSLNAINLVLGVNPGVAFELIDNSIATNLSFERDPVQIMAAATQSRMINCGAAIGNPGEPAGARILGWQNPRLAVRIRDLNYNMYTETDSGRFYPVRTVEGWIRLPAWQTILDGTDYFGIISAIKTSDNTRLFSLYASRTGNGVSETAASRTVTGGFAGGSLSYANAANAILDGSVGPYGDYWHHFAVVLTVTTQQLFIDGIAVGSTAVGALISAPHHWFFGSITDNAVDSDATIPLQGLIRAVRFDSEILYPGTTTFVPPKYLTRGPTTLGLWTGRTSSAIEWDDECGFYPAKVHGGVNAFPHWVAEGFDPAL